MNKIILVITLQQRIETATKFQNLLTEYGCCINTHIGLHTSQTDSCSPTGLVLREIAGSQEEKAAESEKKLLEIGDVVVQKMVF
jgi:hypothetical protein